MRCYACGRRLKRAAATVEEHGCIGHLGPACARKAGRLKQKEARPSLVEGTRRRKRDELQLGLHL